MLSVANEKDIGGIPFLFVCLSRAPLSPTANAAFTSYHFPTATVSLA